MIKSAELQPSEQVIVSPCMQLRTSTHTYTTKYHLLSWCAIQFVSLLSLSPQGFTKFKPAQIKNRRCRHCSTGVCEHLGSDIDLLCRLQTPTTRSYKTWCWNNSPTISNTYYYVAVLVGIVQYKKDATYKLMKTNHQCLAFCSLFAIVILLVVQSVEREDAYYIIL